MNKQACALAGGRMSLGSHVDACASDDHQRHNLDGAGESLVKTSLLGIPRRF